MKVLTAGSLILMLGLVSPLLQARDDRPGRGADYGNQDSKRQAPARGEVEGRGRGEPSPQRAPDRADGGRGERDLNTRIAGWEGGYREPERYNRDEGSRGERGGRDLNTRIAGWEGGYREPEKHNGGDHWRGDGRASGDWRVDQGWRHDNQRRDGRWDNRYEHGRNRRDDWRRPEWRRDWSHGWSGHRYRAPARYVYPRGYRAHSWRIGYHLPPVFIVSNWYVDWRAYRLAPPPWGCRWLRVDGDLLLIDERSGEIVDALYGFFYY